MQEFRQHLNNIWNAIFFNTCPFCRVKHIIVSASASPPIFYYHGQCIDCDAPVFVENNRTDFVFPTFFDAQTSNSVRRMYIAYPGFGLAFLASVAWDGWDGMFLWYRCSSVKVFLLGLKKKLQLEHIIPEKWYSTTLVPWSVLKYVFVKFNKFGSMKRPEILFCDIRPRSRT